MRGRQRLSPDPPFKADTSGGPIRPQVPAPPTCHAVLTGPDGERMAIRSVACPHEDWAEHEQASTFFGSQELEAETSWSVDVAAVAIPETGPLLFVLTVPADMPREAVEAAFEEAGGLAEKLAPGRSQVVAMTEGVTLEVLDDEQLARIGLRRFFAEPGVGPPRYLVLDLWQALGGDAEAFDGWVDDNGTAETWSQLLHIVRRRSGAKTCGRLLDDGSGERCVLLEHSDTATCHGPSDVGRDVLPPIPSAPALAAAALRETADEIDADLAMEAASAKVADVRCVRCDLRHEEREQYGCGESGRGHDYDDEELAAAAAPVVEPTYWGDYLRERADRYERQASDG